MAKIFFSDIQSVNLNYHTPSLIVVTISDVIIFIISITIVQSLPIIRSRLSHKAALKQERYKTLKINLMSDKYFRQTF